MQTPCITVLTGVYNSADYLKEAIESILNQTFTDFEFLIIDDSSSDDSVNVVKSYGDKRIVFIQNEANMGLTKLLNKGIELARGKYIARFDSNDVCMPDRLERQINFLTENASFAGVSSSWELINASGKHISNVKFNLSATEVKCALLHSNCINHSGVMLKKSVLEQYRYDESCYAAQDYELWTRILNEYNIGVLPEILMRIRILDTGISNTQRGLQWETERKLFSFQLDRLGINFSEEELELHQAIYHKSIRGSNKNMDLVEQWFLKLVKANNYSGKYPIFDFNSITGERWFMTCLTIFYKIGLYTLIRYYRSELKNYYKVPLYLRFLIFIKCIIYRFL